MSFPIHILLAAAAGGVSATAIAVPSVPPSNVNRMSETASRPAGPPPALNRADFLKRMDGHFKTLDTNGDGNLDKAELEVAQKRAIQTRNAALVGRVQEQFRALDTNKDGQLSLAEFSAPIGRRQGGLEGTPALDKLDANKDGKVSLDEFRAPISARFDRMDRDNNGVISAAERAPERK